MDKLYTINEVATRLNLSDKTLRRWEEAGRFTPSRTLGNQRRYSVDDLQILDALKHNVISDQKELLNASQAASLCGVSPLTIARWENEGKIHPFITSGYTFYPKSRLLAKLDELKASTPTEEPLPVPPSPSPTLPTTVVPTVVDVPVPISSHSTYPYLINVFLTIIILFTYHFLFNQVSTPVTPQVKGVTTTVFDPRVDDLLTKFQTHLDREMLEKSTVTPSQQIQLDNTSLISGQATLVKGQSQVYVTHSSLSPTSLVTATFSSDFSPARKYWVTSKTGSFTLTTDFPVGADANFTYQFLTPTATPSAL